MRGIEGWGACLKKVLRWCKGWNLMLERNIALGERDGSTVVK